MGELVGKLADFTSAALKTIGVAAGMLITAMSAIEDPTTKVSGTTIAAAGLAGGVVPLATKG